MKKTNFNPNKLLFQAKKYKISKFFKNEWLYFLAVCSNFFKEKGFLKYFAFVYFIYFIGYFGLIRANIYYVDDIYIGLTLEILLFYLLLDTQANIYQN